MKSNLKFDKDSVVKAGKKILSELKALQLIIASVIVLGLIGYAVMEVGQVANTEISAEQEAQKQAELSAKKIEFDEATILEIQARLDEDVDVQPQDLGTDNPFRFNN